MAKEVTLADIADKVGVSNVAVYKALADKPGVSENLRKKIKSVAQEMGYQASSAKKNQITGNIGVVVRAQAYGYSISFYGQLYEKIAKVLYANNFYGILELVDQEEETMVIPPKILQNGNVDGIIVLGEFQPAYMKYMQTKSGVPVVFLDVNMPSEEIDTIITDGYHGTYMLTDYLIRLGHEKIAFVGNVDATGSIADRYWGYRRALRENNLDFQEKFEIQDRDELGRSYETLLKKKQNFDAYVCNSDYAAYLLIQNLEQLGCRVPEDVSVVGYDNFLPIGIEEDRITTYEVNKEAMADAGVKTILRKIQGKKYNKGIQIIPGKMIHKSSVKNRNN